MDEELAWAGWFDSFETLAWWGWLPGTRWLYSGQEGTDMMRGSTVVTEALMEVTP